MPTHHQDFLSPLPLPYTVTVPAATIFTTTVCTLAFGFVLGFTVHFCVCFVHSLLSPPTHSMPLLLLLDHHHLPFPRTLYLFYLRCSLLVFVLLLVPTFYYFFRTPATLSWTVLFFGSAAHGSTRLCLPSTTTSISPRTYFRFAHTCLRTWTITPPPFAHLRFAFTLLPPPACRRCRAHCAAPPRLPRFHALYHHICCLVGLPLHRAARRSFVRTRSLPRIPAYTPYTPALLRILLIDHAAHVLTLLLSVYHHHHAHYPPCRHFASMCALRWNTVLRSSGVAGFVPAPAARTRGLTPPRIPANTADVLRLRTVHRRRTVSDYLRLPPQRRCYGHTAHHRTARCRSILRSFTYVFCHYLGLCMVLLPYTLHHRFYFLHTAPAFCFTPPYKLWWFSGFCSVLHFPRAGSCTQYALAVHHLRWVSVLTCNHLYTARTYYNLLPATRTFPDCHRSPKQV